MDLVFIAGTSNGTIQCLNVTIFDDSLVESNETFTVTLTTSNSVVELGNNLTTITITDTDSMHRWLWWQFLYSNHFDSVPTVSVPAMLSVAEDEETVQVCATLNIQSYTTAVDINVILASSDGTGKTMFNSLLCVIVYLLQLLMVMTTVEYP